MKHILQVREHIDWGWALLIVWLVGAFLTFGWEFNRHECGWQSEAACQSDRALDSIAKGWAWPLYWAGRAAIEVTKP
jgi:hypothetical protein